MLKLVNFRFMLIDCEKNVGFITDNWKSVRIQTGANDLFYKRGHYNLQISRVL